MCASCRHVDANVWVGVSASETVPIPANAVTIALQACGWSFEVVQGEHTGDSC